MWFVAGSNIAHLFLFGDVYNTYLLVEGSSQYPWKAEEHRVAESRVDIRHFKLHMN